MSLSGLSEREAEASRQKYGFNEQKNTIKIGDSIIMGAMSLSCKLFVIAAMLKIVLLLLGLLEVTNSEVDVISIIILFGLAVFSALMEAILRHTSEKKISSICSAAHQSEYTVLRGTKAEKISEKMLTMGDVVYLSEGDVIPADGIVAEGQFTVDQSEFGMLEKIEKTTPSSNSRSGKTANLKSAYSLYKGSVIVKGSGAMKITAIGESVFGAADEDTEQKIHSERFAGLTQAGGVTGVICAVAVLIVCVVMGIISGVLLNGIFEGLSAAAAVLAVSCLCARNVEIKAAAAKILRMLEAIGVTVSKPDILNDMQDTAVIFADKMGVLTEGSFTVSGFIDGTGNQIEKLDDVDEKIIGIIKAAAVNTSSAQLESDGTVYGGTPADRAILGFVKKASGKVKVKKHSSVQKGGITGVTVNLDSKLITFFSGSAEVVLDKCTDSFSADGKKRRITNKDALAKLAATISLTGNDVVALAVCDSVIKNDKLPNGGYTLIGMIVLHDKLLDEAEEAVKALEKDNVKTIFVTSASRESMIYALKKAAKKTKGVILSSEQLSKISDSELKRKISEIRAVVNADTADKLRLLRAASEQGMKTCMIGAEFADVHVFDETDTAIASPVCTSAVRKVSDASAKSGGISAVSALISYSRKFTVLCKTAVFARIFCTVCVAVLTVISAIWW